LVRRDDGLIRLFDPPFAKSALEPGYVKGYPPGVRENGGQYTHAAVWAVMAFAELNQTERAWELFSMINPIRHATNERDMNRYAVEPYVVAADVYAVAPHVGRGGWTWYTGSAGWMYRLIVESLLGVQLEVDQLRLNPRMPQAWDAFKMHYRYRDTFYHMDVKRSGDKRATPIQISVDGQAQDDGLIHLVDDRQDHVVEVTVGG